MLNYRALNLKFGKVTGEIPKHPEFFIGADCLLAKFSQESILLVFYKPLQEQTAIFFKPLTGHKLLRGKRLRFRHWAHGNIRNNWTYRHPLVINHRISRILNKQKSECLHSFFLFFLV